MYGNQMNKIAKVLLMLLLSTQTSAWSQGRQLSLGDALQYAMEASHSMRKARLEIENSIHRSAEIRGKALPQININGTLNYNPLLQLTALPGELLGQPGKTLMIAMGQKWNSGASVSMTQSLFDKTLITGLKASAANTEYQHLNVALTEEQLIEQVAAAYYQVLVQRHKIAIIDSTISYTAKVRNVIKGQYENGLAKQIDLDRISVNVSNMRTQRQQLANGVEQLENQLKYAMGMDITVPINLPPVDFSNIGPKLLTLVDAMVIEDRPELRLLKKQEQLLALQKESYRAARFPVLAFTGNYGHQGQGNTMPWFKGQQQGVNWFDYASLGLSLKIPVFNGFTTRAKMRQADIEVRKVREDIAQTDLMLNMENENARVQVRNSLVILDEQKENVGLAQRVFENTRNNYDNGLAPLTDLLEIEKSLTEANNNHAAALLDYKLAELKLIKAQGNLKSLLNK